MGSGSLATTQFSIYKINFVEIEHEFAIARTDDVDQYIQTVITTLINSIAKIVKERPFSHSYRVEYNGFYGLFFKTVHEPSWGGIAREMMEGNQFSGNQSTTSKDFLKNTNVSYVLLYPYDTEIYAVTGGYGSNYINKFVEKNYGLYLLPKVVQKNNPVVKSIVQNNLLGNQTATQKTNKLSTSISLEQDMSSIFRQLNIEIDRDVAEDLGIEFGQDEAESKKINLVNKDSIVVRRSLSLAELKTLIKSIRELEKLPDNFALNYLVLAKKKRIKNADLFEQLIKTLLNKEYDRFLLAGDDYTTFYTGADRYILCDDEGTELINQTAPITFLDTISQIPEQKYSKTALRTLLKKWTISTMDNAGTHILHKLSIFDAIQGFIEFGADNRPCYLFNGLWYVFDERFSQTLTKDFESFFDQQAQLSASLATSFGLYHKSANEDAYNHWLRDNPKIIVAHTVLKDYVEIADAIFWDDNTLYLMHNKKKFDGSGARDVTNQVLTAAEYLQQNLARGGNTHFLESYYDAIVTKYTEVKKSLVISKSDFVAAFNGQRNITYVIGYINNYKKSSRATYAKYLTIETKKKLAIKGFACNVINVSP